MDAYTFAAGAASTMSIAAAAVLWRRAKRAEAMVAEQQQEMRAEKKAAHRDPLTGLLNRRTFYQLASAVLADPPNRPMVAVLINFDDFTRINTAYGHRIGDQLLASLARRFCDYTSGNLVARVDGDEFAALLPCSAAPGGGVYPDARSITRILGAPQWAGGYYLRVNASVGLATVHGPTDIDDVLRRASVHMRDAKGQARTRPAPPTMTIHGNSFRYPAPGRYRNQILPRRRRRRVRSFQVRLVAQTG